ncbi:hypothetical protein [Demequina salsinemoris]|uniref:hypothetical protein n=1 Tax=Demequina salsinemoris TaxID=577470 RepID=UPI00078457E8|nr:hypothetical protein [Demequina salsinemoris]
MTLLPASPALIMLYGVACGLVLGVWGALMWRLWHTKSTASEAAFSVIVLVSALYGLGADAWGWWTPGTWAREAGLIGSAGDTVLFAISVFTAAVVTGLSLTVIWNVFRPRGAGPAGPAQA